MSLVHSSGYPVRCPLTRGRFSVLPAMFSSSRRSFPISNHADSTHCRKSPTPTAGSLAVLACLLLIAPHHSTPFTIHIDCTKSRRIASHACQYPSPRAPRASPLKPSSLLSPSYPLCSHDVYSPTPLAHLPSSAPSAHVCLIKSPLLLQILPLMALRHLMPAKRSSETR